MFVSVRQLVIEILWKYRLFPGGPRIRVTSSVTFKGNFVLAFIRELSTWVIHTKTWPRDVLRGGKKSSLFIFSNKYVFSYNVNNTGSSTFSLLNTNQKSLLSHSKSTKNIAPQREKSGMRSPLGFSQPFHRHLPRALFFQVLMERNKGFASLKISKLELGRQTVNKLLCSNKCYGMLQKHSNETFGKEMEHQRRLAA